MKEVQAQNPEGCRVLQIDFLTKKSSRTYKMWNSGYTSEIYNTI